MLREEPLPRWFVRRFPAAATLRRYATRGRVRPYWASGLEVFYDTDDDLNDLDQSWRSSVGFEYPLDEGMFLAFEYELDATYMRSRRLDERGGVVDKEEGAGVACLLDGGAPGARHRARCCRANDRSP